MAFIPISVMPTGTGPSVHASGNCNGLCSPPKHVEILWCHPSFPIEEVSPEAFDRTFRMWTACSARLVGRAELPPRETDGWIPWTVAVEDLRATALNKGVASAK